LWLVAGLLTLVAILAVVALVDFAVPHPLQQGWVSAAVGAVGLLVVLTVPYMRYRRWRYALREHDLWIRQGLLTVTVSVIPYRRLQFVDTRQGPLDRLFGLSQLVVHTAALGTAGRLPGLDAEHAERLRETLAQLEPDDALV
jgi:membrane protein YdbS with pleckstrin-like domain